MALRNAFENLAVEAKQDTIITGLSNLLTELQQKYEGGAVALDAATLAALETVTASVSNWPANFPLPTSQVGTLTPQKDALTDGQLRAAPVEVTVNNQPTVETGLAKEATLASILGQLDDATTDTVLSVLKALLAELGQKLEPGGSVSVSNFPATQTIQDGGGSITVDGTVTVGNTEFALPATQVTSLKAISNFPSTYALPAAQVTDLKTVSVDNFPIGSGDPATDTTLVQVRDRLPSTGTASEATLELVRAQTAAINANTDAIEALLTELRDNQFRRTDPIAAGTNVLGSVSVTGVVLTEEQKQDYALAIKEGRAYFSGAKQAGTNGNYASLLLANPGTSTRQIFIVGYTLSSDTNVDVSYVNDATSTGTIIPSYHSNQNYQAVPGFESMAVVYAGDNALSGGNDMTPVTRLGQNIPVQYQFPFVLPPGQSFAVRANAAALSTVNLYCGVFWYEVAA